MAIFNSYVKLPEGKSVSLVDFSRKMLDEIDEMFKKKQRELCKKSPILRWWISSTTVGYSTHVGYTDGKKQQELGSLNEYFTIKNWGGSCLKHQIWLMRHLNGFK